MNSANKKKAIRRRSAPVAKKIKEGGITLVSEALVKKSSTNLIPKIHVKRGDLVKVISGSRKFRGQTGKVLQVFPQNRQIKWRGQKFPHPPCQTKTANG